VSSLSNSVTKKPLKYLGIDAGGTFTDFVLIDQENWTIHKALSTPENPAKAILLGIEELGLSNDIKNGTVCIIHGSTVATNAALERKGAKTVYVANKGFKDVLTIGRQARKELYNLNQKPPIPPVPGAYCLEVDCRRDTKGKLITALHKDEVQRLVDEITMLQPEAVAINLLFSFLVDDEEKRIESALNSSFFVSRSSFVLPKYKEYERGMATWLNASLGPKVNAYMNELIEALHGCSISVMQSSGGTISVEQAANRAVNLLLSGPAGGLSAVRSLGLQCQQSQFISFDMGGTSTDVSLMDGDFQLTDEGKINDWPVAIPMLDMETIGAGGGSIAWLDAGNLLHVGPQSAGSKPGPACYNLGGSQPTVSDANVVLGRLRPEAFLGGKMSLNIEAAHRAINSLASQLSITVLELAEGIIQLAEQQMVKALNTISVQKGHHPRDFILCCFGGAGGLHVCSLAEQLNMEHAIIPTNSGVLSAYGMLTAPKKRQLTRTFIAKLKDIELDELEQHFKKMEKEGIDELLKEHVPINEISTSRSFDLRYQGQSFTLNIPFTDTAADLFTKKHLQQYGHQLNSPVELVNLCVSLSAKAALQQQRDQYAMMPQSASEQSTKQIEFNEVALPKFENKVAVFQRDMLNTESHVVGPAIIIENVSTTWLKPGWQLNTDQFGNLHLKKIKTQTS
jgi:N-methylhydantoinase A